MISPRLLLRHLDRSLLSLVPLVTLLLMLGAGSSGCAGTATGEHVAGKPERAYTMDDVARNQQVKLPSFVTPEVQEGYEYALAHPDKLQYIPCYCGCGLTAGHKNNVECYIAGVDKEGMVVLDNHASFCTVCMEITRDVKRLVDEGKPPKEIRAYVDEKHSPKGPGTETPQPPA